MNTADQPQTQTGSGFAVTALVLGIVGLIIIIIAPVALVFGIIALTKGQSKGMAITGIVLGSIGTLILPIAIIAAIAIPSMLESRVTANDAAAAATLKSGVFPAQVMFQASAALDADKNGVGEYASDLTWLAGAPFPGSTGGLHYLPTAFAIPGPVNGYNFRCAGGNEHGWVVYAWPVSRATGQRRFAICTTGTIYVDTAPGDPAREPATYDLWGGAAVPNFDQPPAGAWKPYQR